MNVERCISLHNEIVRHGWVGSGRSPDTLASHGKSWFQVFGEEAEAERSNLSPDLVQFLEQVQIPRVEEEGFYPEFFYWVQGLSHPEYMFEFEDMLWDYDYTNEQEKEGNGEEEEEGYEEGEGDEEEEGIEEDQGDEEEEGDKGRRLVLYDQKTNLCTLSLTTYDTDDISTQTWYPLEAVLTFWLSQIRNETIQAAPEKGGKLRGKWPDVFDEYWEHAPWVFLPYNENMLKHNLDVWEKLAEAIESRMPAACRSQAANRPVYGLLEDNIRNTIDIPQRFAYNFLFRARRPRFKMIAPGLRIITSADFPDQPFRSYMSKDKEEVPPILLFQSDLNFSEDPSCTPQSPDDAMVPNFFDHRGIKTYPSGLYLLPTNHRSLEDGISFVLPYAIGGKGCAKRGDGTNFGGEKDGPGIDSYTELYQPGRRALEDFQAQSLAGVLESWLGMVERGDWKVDENGVMGDMETWRGADTEEGWMKYVVPSEE
ncbi:uncharacterized protein J4E87_009653 [Alternaria ethzedia]|uniref:uncharacterized protein n=1 Tax=Alternaria ethzedia TaxID=181014 RepID=UPI0020C1D402|nr:uncharacterized protein J4E87_009653 [Alternaria ethzedia]KAI4614255.1 hypothetical protein J4E87_009653 [Alternaria ethzedia]